MDFLDAVEGVVVYAGISMALTAVVLLVVWNIARRWPNKLMRRNFRGDLVPVIGGYPSLILPLIPGGLGFWFLSHSSDTQDADYVALALAVATSGFALVGLVDDLWGDRSAGGFRGHFRKLIKERRLTTGLIKVFAGGSIALVSALLYVQTDLNNPAIHLSDLLRFSPHQLYSIVALYGVFIALSANTTNLLDLRPGRCVSVVAVLSLLALVLSGGAIFSMLILGASLALLPFDRAGKIMLGDCGSNSLGAALAVCWLGVLSYWEVAICVVLLAAFQIWCEKYSLSRLIESKPFLRALDRKIGVR